MGAYPGFCSMNEATENITTAPWTGSLFGLGLPPPVCRRYANLSFYSPVWDRQ